ncbi:TetR/AcrR family transcriptional regulator [Actinomadura graeca]|uniref:TetR/AcrR family transcriptional regulator n=1 Tax=Actinomadura graeca TaxID=2750812 RepID=A0ABX8QZX8_9ACTN|nr:TetR/AcrR family transcriptional regulator [Actinomadura graeca]QXJ22343.1 TetR/AcrR family transcriptional regulator [Actinomadura graeca]
MATPRRLSTADERRTTVVRTATDAFAARGYYGTTTTEVARHAGISQAYLYRLFPGKEALFVAVVNHCADRILQCLADSAAQVRSGDPEAILFAMGDAYARLIVDRNLPMVLMQAKCAASEPAIGEAIRACYAEAVEYVREVSGASEGQIQMYFLRGFWCDAVTAMAIDQVDAPWARTLARGLAHYPPQEH